MKSFIVLAAAVVCATASPGVVYSGLHGLALAPATRNILTVAHAPAITYAAPAVTSTQYHSQDELGQASYGYAHPGQAHSTVRDAFGNVAGSYAYINAEGKEVRVNYVADALGFRVASNDLPVAPTAPEAPKLQGPAPVQDTPEVAAAKAAHTKAIEEARARNAEADKADADKPQSRRKRGIYAAAAPIAYAAPITYAAPTVAIAHPAIAHPAILTTRLF